MTPIFAVTVMLAPLHLLVAALVVGVPAALALILWSACAMAGKVRYE